MILLSSSTCMTPNPVASSSEASRQPTVTSAPEFDVLLQHLLVVHLVDVVAGQHDHEMRIVAFDDVDVLVDRVGGAKIPHCLGHALRGREDVEAFVALGPQEVPAALQVTDEAVGLVLRRHRDAANAGIERVREGEVDDARLAARNRRRAWRAGPSAPAGGCRVLRRGRRPSRDGSRARKDPSPWRCVSWAWRSPPQAGACSSAGGVKTRYRVASGGRASVAEHGKPWEGLDSATTSPKLPMFEPP